MSIQNFIATGHQQIKMRYPGQANRFHRAILRLNKFDTACELQLYIEWFRSTPCLFVAVYMYIDRLVQDCSNSIANSLELLQSCIKPSICKSIGAWVCSRKYHSLFTRVPYNGLFSFLIFTLYSTAEDCRKLLFNQYPLVLTNWHYRPFVIISTQWANINEKIPMS